MPKLGFVAVGEQTVHAMWDIDAESEFLSGQDVFVSHILRDAKAEHRIVKANLDKSDCLLSALTSDFPAATQTSSLKHVTAQEVP